MIWRAAQTQRFPKRTSVALFDLLKPTAANEPPEFYDSTCRSNAKFPKRTSVAQFDLLKPTAANEPPKSMKHITEKINIPYEQSRSLDLYLDSGKYAILDIETTGLSPAYSSVILVGILIVETDSEGNITQTLNQLFATTAEDEFEILSNTAHLIEDCKYIVTFNGRFFDVPFLFKRSNKYNVSMPEVFDLDLFVLLKYYSDLPKILPRMNQKTIEQYAGIDNLRQDRISGGESVDLYNQYLETGSKDLEKRILLHNSDDVKQLMRLTSLLKNVDIHRAFYKTGFPVDCIPFSNEVDLNLAEYVNAKITGINLKKSELIVQGTSSEPKEYISFPSIESPYTFRMSRFDGKFEIELPCKVKDNNTYVDIIFLENHMNNIKNNNMNSYIGSDSVLDTNKEGKISSFSALYEFIISLPSYVNGFAILKENGSLNYPLINALSKLLVISAIGLCS